MKKPFFLLIALFGYLIPQAQTLPKDSLFVHLPDGTLLKLQNPGRRLSLYARCYSTSQTLYAADYPGGPQFPTTVTTSNKAYYFRKGLDSPIQRLTLHNLQIAMADNPASVHELRVGRTNLYLGIGLLAGGIALSAIDLAATVHHNHQLSAGFDQASAKWFAQAQTNPNAPLPALPHYSTVSPLFYLGAAASFSALIPLFNMGKHTQKALQIYNGTN